MVVRWNLKTENNSAYIDGIKQFDPCITVEDLNANLSDICSQYIANQGWKKSLTSQLEAQAKQNVNIENYEMPEVVLMDKEPEEGSPANPVDPEPTPEPVEDDNNGGEE